MKPRSFALFRKCQNFTFHIFMNDTTRIRICSSFFISKEYVLSRSYETHIPCEYIGIFLVSRARNTNSLRRPVKLLLCIFDVKKLAKLKWHRDQDENQAEKKIELNIVLLVDETHMHSQFKNKCGQSLHIFVASFVCLQQ